MTDDAMEETTGKKKRKKKSEKMEKRQRHMRKKWPPWEDELGDDDNPDGMPGCEDCVHKSVNPKIAWTAFYSDENSLRDSYCIGYFKVKVSSFFQLLFPPRLLFCCSHFGYFMLIPTSVPAWLC
jgi:hypothetical protein